MLYNKAIMNYFATAAEMAELDRIAVEKGLQIRQMMELAGYQILKVMTVSKAVPGSKIAIVCGKGNKGGDGLSAARHLINAGYGVKVFLLERNISDDSQHHLNLLQQMNITIHDFKDQSLQEFDFIIDALVGYRMRGQLEGDYAAAAGSINDSSAKVIAYDLPTGIDATSGVASGPYIKADYTLMLALAKTGLKGPHAVDFGEVILADLGIPSFLYDRISPGSRPTF